MKTRSVVLAVLVALVLSGCETSNVESAAETPPPQVEVVKATAVSVQPWKTFTTRIEAPERVDLRPRISGVIESVHFVEGQQVEKGQLLFSLDQRHLIAQVEQLKSELVRAEAAFDQARQEAQRARRLVARQAIAEEQAELRESVERQTQAEVAAIKARLAAAELDLSYASIRAPISGTIARANITAGNTVTANQSLLTNISSNQSRYAYFDMDERTWHQHFSNRDHALGVPVLLQLTGETGFPHRGQIDFVDNAIDTGTGTLSLRAVLSGGDDAPVPGAFARVRLAVAKASQKILVPDRGRCDGPRQPFRADRGGQWQNRVHPSHPGRPLWCLPRGHQWLGRRYPGGCQWHSEDWPGHANHRGGNSDGYLQPAADPVGQ